MVEEADVNTKMSKENLIAPSRPNPVMAHPECANHMVEAANANTRMNKGNLIALS